MTQKLGEYLRQTRKTKGLDLHNLAEETKISFSILTAIEEDNYQDLPPLTFARGLYSIYAQNLGLDPKDVLVRFDDEIKGSNKDEKVTPTPSRLAKEIGAMAERPQGPPTLFFGVTFLTLIVFIAVVCWYYSINPARLVSEKLRSLQKTAHVATDVVDPSQAATYVVEATFPEPATIKIALDNSAPKSVYIQAGEKLKWSANQTLEFVLPENTGATFFLNGKLVVFPPPENGKIRLFLPQSSEES